MASVINEVRAELEQRLKDLRGQVDAIERALEALSDETKPSGTGRGAPRGRRAATPAAGTPSAGTAKPKAKPRKRGGGRRAPRGQNKTLILGVLERRPGVTVAEISDETGIEKPTIRAALHKMKQRGDLRLEDGKAFLVSS